MNTVIAPLCALFIAIGIGCGAFGAHGLRGVVPDSDLLIWEKAVFYHVVHAFAALALVLFNSASLSQITARRIATTLLASVAIFSGSLYLLVLTNTRWLGAITPVGGVGFILSWLYLSFTLLARNQKP
jgi:uncharacterized membrane protein YgdD (TMEM256/DUF423 family)